MAKSCDLHTHDCLNDSSVLQKLDQSNDNVETAYKIFEDMYKTAFERTYVSDIVNGESIAIKDENILVNDVDTSIDAVNFEKRLKACTKKLYDYQVMAIRQLIELEKNGYHINTRTFEKTVSNGWILSLPIGSGKSIVFLFLALWYRNVAKHPIIVSKTGGHIPIYEQVQFKYYPYYYEDCCYTEHPYIMKDGRWCRASVDDLRKLVSDQSDETITKGYVVENIMNKLVEDGVVKYLSDDNCVVAFEGYTQNPMTIILTHSHLLDQMRRYIHEDFPAFVKGKGTNINICRTAQEIRPTDNIVIIPANETNVASLVEMSHDKPFMRVIIDDYTSMTGIDSFRQILASSTIFVSGSGFERSPELIPTSYYTLKYSPCESIKLVGLPEQTYKGVVRNNIAMIKLLGSSCDFSDYDFIQKVEEKTMSTFGCQPQQIYPYLSSNSIKDYMCLYFILLNRDKLRSAINAVDKDYDISGKYPRAKYSDKKHEVKHFIEWVTKLGKGNKLLEDLFAPAGANNSNNESIPLVQQICMCCKKTFLEHNGYGVVMSCCGAFYCENCIKNMTTHTIADKLTGEFFDDHSNYYCSCCRRKNPTALINMTKKKDKAVYAFNIITNNFMDESIKDSIRFDYYFYMLIHGLVPSVHDGVPINIHSEIERKIFDENVFKTLNNKRIDDKVKEKILTGIRTIFSMDHLMIRSVDCINRSLIAVKQTFEYVPYILFYNAPKYMEGRLRGYIQNYEQYLGRKGGNNPITKVQPIFMDSIEGLIGIHLNVIAIVVFGFGSTTKDGIKQLLGRCLRINTFNNKLTFFITPDTVSFA